LVSLGQTFFDLTKPLAPVNLVKGGFMVKCILVVDDEEAIRESFRLFLEDEGYQVVTANDPSFCQAIMTNSVCPLGTPCCDILIVDYSMPKMNGLDFLKDRAKRHCKGVDIPAALMSGCLPEGGRKRLESIGCTFFQKPVRFSTIQKWIETLPE
jgi:CheY-like chemotaxis protein